MDVYSELRYRSVDAYKTTIVNCLKQRTAHVTNIRVFTKILVLFIIVTIIFLSWVAYLKKLRRDIILNDDSMEGFENVQYKGIKRIFDNLNNTNRIIHIKYLIKNANDAQKIHNTRKFGAMKEDTIVIVIQVHSEIIYLAGLLRSLLVVKGITKCLLVFSHDHYNESINDIIRNITFARFVQIYYPFSSQVYPTSFPGDDMNLCTGDFECKESVIRVSKLAQKKHFWWWQLSFVFDHLRIMQKYKGVVLFLEDNQYVLMDSLYIVKIMQNMMRSKCPGCKLISLGAHKPHFSMYQFLELNFTINILQFMESTVGLGFNRNFWRIIKKYSYNFCHYDNYRWDASLRYLASTTHQRPYKVFACEAPRILSYRQCDGNLYCNNMEGNVLEMEKFASSVATAMFPLQFEMKLSKFDKIYKSPPDGSWIDVRDQELCMHMVKD